MLQFPCPQCQKVLKAPEEKAGLSVKCPGCGQIIVIPEAEQPATSEAVSAGTPAPGPLPVAPEFSSADDVPRKQAGGIPVWVLIAIPVAGVALSLMCCVGVFALIGFRAASTNSQPTTFTTVQPIGPLRPVQVQLPGGWRERNDLNVQANFQASGPLDQAFIIVISEAKDDFADRTLDAYLRATLDPFKQRLGGAQVVKGPVRMTINDRPAIQHEVNGTVNNINITYLHTVVDGPSGFHQVLGWAARSRFESQRATLESIIKSFQETGKPPPAGMK